MTLVSESPHNTTEFFIVCAVVAFGTIEFLIEVGNWRS